MDEGKVLIKLRNIQKSYGSQQVLDGVDLDVYEGEFLTFLGPSGCGKTTLLRMINGFDTPDEGSVWLDGVDQEGIAPNKRELNTVFQSYALFPHLTVRDNIAFGLRIKKLPEAEVKARVDEVIEMTKLEALADRKPGKLSGGQQQRVAIARSLVNKPKVLLLDEPLGALDMKLRKQMQMDLKQMQRDSGITYVYVTHDQEEALTISDRIVVLNKGTIEQQGDPWEIYHHPKTEFVASFLGESNFFSGELIGEKKEITVAVRPEFIRVKKEKESEKAWKALVKNVIYLGVSNRLELILENQQKVYALSQESFQIGDSVYIDWKAENGELIRKTQEEQI